MEVFAVAKSKPKTGGNTVAHTAPAPSVKKRIIKNSKR